MEDLNLSAYMRTEERLEKGAEIALKNRLYVPGWSMYSNLKESPYSVLKLIVIARVDNKAVGCGLITKEYRDEDDFCSVFVRRKYRRQGIGRAIYAQAKKSLRRKRDFDISAVTDTQQKFWDKVLV